MPEQEMITLRNKKTGEVVQVPRSQFKQLPPRQEKGWKGIGSDVAESWKSAPAALGEMVKSIPDGINKVGDFATSHNPVTTMANLGAGVVESGAGLLSAPQMLVRYLAEKFPEFGNAMERSGKSSGGGSYKDPTFYEGLMNFEQEHGMAPREGEESVRNAGGLLGGGKALTKLPGMLARTGAVASEQAGRGGDPLHAAILAMAGDMMAKTPVSKLKTIPQSTVEAVKNIPENARNIAEKIPEMAGSGAASVLESAADYGSKLPLGADVLQPTVGALASYLKHKSIAPDKLAQRKLFGDISADDLPKITERLDAANRLGISFLTPGEAMLSPFQTAKEANIGQTSSGAKLLYEKGGERVGTEGKAIDNLLETIYNDKELSPEKKAAYDDAMASTVPFDFMEKWKEDPVVAKAIKQIDSEAEYKRAARNMPKDSFEYWNLVKRVVGDLETENPKGIKKTKSDEATKARKAMVSEMDVINPKYKTARNIAERQFTRKELEDVFDKKSMTLNNFWSFLKSDAKFNKMMAKLDAFPEAQQKLKDIRTLSNQMIPFDDSIRTAYKLEKTGMTKKRNKLDALKQDLDERYGQEHDVATVNLMTDPKWINLLTEYIQKNQK